MAAPDDDLLDALRVFVEGSSLTRLDDLIGELRRAETDQVASLDTDAIWRRVQEHLAAATVHDSRP